MSVNLAATPIDSHDADHHTPEQMVTVHVREDITAVLAGHEGRCYVSPPQPRVTALELVTLLLGRAARDDEDRWARPIAGGQRTITLIPAG